MEVKTHRFFRNTATGRYFMERITYRQAENDDPRAVMISGQNGLWIPIMISNPGFDINMVKPTVLTYKTQIISNENGTVSEVSVPETYDSPVPMDCMSKPLMDNVVEITMEEYNEAMTPV